MRRGLKEAAAQGHGVWGWGCAQADQVAPREALRRTLERKGLFPIDVVWRMGVAMLRGFSLIATPPKNAKGHVARRATYYIRKSRGES